MSPRKPTSPQTPEDADQRRRAGTLGGLTTAMRMTPEERTERARKAGLAAAAKRRADSEAAGRVIKPRAPRVMPGLDELEPYLEAIDAEPRNAPLTYEQRMREAVIRHRRDVASIAVEAAKRRAGQ